MAIQIDKDYACVEEYFAMQAKMSRGIVSNDAWQAWYMAHCPGCKYESVICMYGEDGFDVESKQNL